MCVTTFELEIMGMDWRNVYGAIIKNWIK